MVGLVPQVFYHGQFLCNHLCGNLLQHLSARGLKRQCSDNNFTSLLFVTGTHAHTAASARVGFKQLGFRGNDFCAGWKIRTLDYLAEFSDRTLRLVE